MELVKKKFNNKFDSLNLIETCYIKDKIVTYLKYDNCIGRTLREGHYWEYWMLNYISSNYKPNTNILDLGGNIGTTSLLLSSVLSTNCKVFTFEPIYNDILLKNVLDNKLSDKIDVFPYGVGNKQDVMKISKINLAADENFGGISIIDRVERDKDKDDHMEIAIYPVDMFNFENVSLIKIDVEHMEIQALEGCLDLIKRCKPTILIETYHYHKLIESRIYNQLTELGYDIDVIPEGCYDFILKVK